MTDSFYCSKCRLVIDRSQVNNPDGLYPTHNKESMVGTSKITLRHVVVPA